MPSATEPLPLIVIAGPTGAGKTELTLRLAEHFHGEIVNCDSLQLYRGFDIGTAKLPSAQRRGIPHHLIDVLDPSESFSAGDYARLSREAIAGISARGRLPIVAGGTGFYLRALLDGLPSLPGRDQDLRAKLTAREQRKSGAVHRILARLDPAAAARIHPRDVQKAIRALEVRLLTNRPLPAAETAESLTGYRVLQIGLDPDRAQLCQSLDGRVREMFAKGLVEEVQRLLANGCSGDEKPFESLGYKQALRHLRGTLTLEEAIASTQLETRQYAKRQLTWFRRDQRIHWVHDFGNSPFAIEHSSEYIRKN